jgi:DNA processing protein
MPSPTFPTTDRDALDLAARHAALGIPSNSFRRLAASPKSSSDQRGPASIDSALRRHSIRLLHRGRPEWLTAFDDLRDPPLLLYARGRALPAGDLLAVVGSRTEQPYARAVARDLVARWSALRPSGGIVSGGGLGVDHAALSAALTFGLHPVVVLAGGVDKPSPRTLAPLFEAVLARGTLLSEAPPGMRPSRAAFPDRNRLIAAAAVATVVVRGARRSGSLSTLNASRLLGRPTFAVVGPIDDPLSAGLHDAIRSGKASALLHIDDIGVLGSASASTPRSSSPETGRAEPSGDSPEELIVRRLSRSPAHPDALAEDLGLTSSAVAGIIAALELKGRVLRVAGGAFQAL